MEYKTIDELGEIITGKTPSTSQKELWDGDTPFLTPSDYSYSDRYIHETERSISKKGVESQVKTYLPKDAVCVTCIGSTVGKSCMTVCPTITNQQINSIICNDNYDAHYVFYLMKYCLPFLQMYGAGTGSGLPIISKNKFGRIRLSVFADKEYQRQISYVLSKYDDLIDNNTKRIKILEQMAENLYKEWFVRFRFPGHEDVEFENGIPKGWEIKNLFNVANVKYGYAFASDEFCDDKTLHPVVRIRDIQNNKTNTYTAEECDHKYKIKENDILIGMDGIFHMCLWCGGEAYLNQRVVEIESKKANDMCNYLLYFSIFPQVKFWEQTISGTTVAHLGDKHLKKMKVIIPDGPTLRKANAIVTDIMNKICSLRKCNDNLIKQRDLLLPRLMSGKLEVK